MAELYPNARIATQNLAPAFTSFKIVVQEFNLNISQAPLLCPVSSRTPDTGNRRTKLT